MAAETKVFSVVVKYELTKQFEIEAEDELSASDKAQSKDCVENILKSGIEDYSDILVQVMFVKEVE